MSSKRRPVLAAHFKLRIPGQCRVCAKPIRGKGDKPSRAMWHKDCLHWYMLATHGSYLRQKVKQRDKGICARCGLDTVKNAEIYRQTRDVLRWLWIREFREAKIKEMPGLSSWYAGCAAVDRIMEKEIDAELALRGMVKPPRHAAVWQADHIIALCLGNGEPELFELSNVQTLCHACHAAKTKEDIKKFKDGKKSTEAN